MLDLEAALAGRAARPRADPDLRQRRRLLRHPARSRARTSATASGSVHGDVDGGLRARPTSSSRRRSGRPPPSTRRWSRTRRLASWDGDRLEVWTGTHTPFNVRSDLAGRLRDRRGERPRRLPADGRLVRREDLRPRSRRSRRRSRARRAGPCSCVLPRDEEWVTINRHPALLTGQARRDARTGRSSRSEVESWIDTGAYADCGPGRRA